MRQKLRKIEKAKKNLRKIITKQQIFSTKNKKEK